MKLLSYLFTLFFAFNALAVAPYGIKGQQQAPTLYSNVHQFPNNQVTNLGGINALVESGNSNILSNPSFEHSTFSTDWSFSGTSSFFEDVTRVLNGKKSSGILAVSTSFALVQDSTLYASQFAGQVQGIATVRIKANAGATNIKVCSRQAGVTSTTNCVDVVANDTWGLYKVPFILGATSNGISIASTGNTTSVVYIDDAFVGAVDLQAINSFDTTCPTIACETNFSAKISAAGAVSGENLDWLASCSNPTTGTYNCTINGGVFTQIANCTATAEGAVGSPNTAMLNITSATALSAFLRNTSNGAQSSVWNLACQKQGADYTAAIAARVAYQKTQVASYSSTNADTDWASCGLTGASFTGFGTVTAIETQCKRQGSDLLMKGKFTSGTVTAVESRVSLPLWNGTQLVSAGTSKIPSFQILGSSVRSNVGAANNIFAAIQPSSSYFVFTSLASPAGTTSILGSSFGSSETQTMGVLRIPINGWSQSNIIIGQFNGLQTCTDTLACTDTFSAVVSSAGVVSGENVDWINGNATIGGTSVYSLTYKTGIFTAEPTCVMTAQDAANFFYAQEYSRTASSISVMTSNGIAQVAKNFRIVCQKQGADYIGKTAMAVASDQNLRTPGVTKAVINSCKINNNGTATIDSSSGLCSSWVSSVSRTSIGNVSVNILPNTFANNPVCSITTHTNLNVIPQRIQTASPSVVLAVFITPNTAALADSDFNITCHGVSP